MNATTRGKGRPTTQALRWNLQQAASEFGMHREGLEKRRRAIGIDPGEDGKFSTRDIAAMVFGDKEAETIGKIAAERIGQEMKNAREAGEVMPTASAAKVAERFLVPCRQRILSSSLTDEEKDELLADLVGLGEVDWMKEARSANK